MSWDDFMIWAGLPTFTISAFASFSRLVGPFDDRYPTLTGAATAAFVFGAYLFLRWGELRVDYAASIGASVMGAAILGGIFRARRRAASASRDQ